MLSGLVGRAVHLTPGLVLGTVPVLPDLPIHFLLHPSQCNRLAQRKRGGPLSSTPQVQCTGSCNHTSALAYSPHGQAAQDRVPGAVYHITARGNVRQEIYPSDGDQEAFLKIPGPTLNRPLALTGARPRPR
jgi:hypothetical protein